VKKIVRELDQLVSGKVFGEKSAFCREKSGRSVRNVRYAYIKVRNTLMR
jgi:hypothetical protein